MKRGKPLKNRKPLKARKPLSRGGKHDRAKPMSKKGGLKRGRAPRKKPRSDGEFRRVYGSEDRVLAVAGMACVGCGARGACENHHVKNGGMGRKADACWIVPLCAVCHERLHRQGASAFGGVDFERAARAVEAQHPTRE